MSRWLERRTGVRELLQRHGRDLAVPEDRAAGLGLGALLVFLLGLQLVSGILLLVHFVPVPAEAFESVRGLMRDVPYGWLVRLAHAHGASWMVAILFVHLFRTAWQGAYKEPRELVWVSGCVLLLLVLAAALTGSVLPWSQMSFWGATIVTASFSYVPLVGDRLAELIRGGELVGDAAYRRAFAAHVGLLPLLLLGAVALHLALVRRAGLAVRPRRRGDPTASRMVPFHPRVTARLAVNAVALSIGVAATVFFLPGLFFPAEHLVPADPFQTPPDVKPEWYFLWSYALARRVPEGFALGLQAVALCLLFALPFLDRGPHRHPRERPVFALGIALAFVSLLALGVLGARA